MRFHAPPLATHQTLASLTQGANSIVAGSTPNRSASALQKTRVWRPYDVSRHDGPASASVADFGPDSGDAGLEATPQEDPKQRRMRLEAVLLVAKTPLTTRKLAQLAHLADGTEARTLVRQLNQIYDQFGRALRIEQIAGGYRMMTRQAYAPWLNRLEHLPSAIRLSSPMMETLAVVAYRGPVSRADIEAIRGVSCGELLRQLMERDLIRIAGRSEDLGRPYLYDTTKQFLRLFGLPSLDALPAIDWDPVT
ncbi:MAG: SMC-Scp complex subunit ScpB [Planctomycetota bacterium]